MNSVDKKSFNWLAHQINNRCVLDNLSLVRGRVVDLGCGTAPYTEAILSVADSYTGVDWGSSFHGSEHVDVQADLSAEVPLPDRSVDTVVSFQVMEHLKEPEVFLRECYRLLDDNGGLLLTVPFMWEVHEAPHDYYRFTRHGLEYLLEKVGFAQVRITENTGFWQTAVLKFNYHTATTARKWLQPLLIPLWWLGQTVAPILDRRRPRPSETASYTVTAIKPPPAS